MENQFNEKFTAYYENRTYHNLLGVVLDVNEVGQYKVGTKAGILPQRFTRNQLAPCDSNFLSR